MTNKLIMLSYNRQVNNRVFPLNQRGYRQAERNNSHSIWSLLAWSQESKNQNEETFQTRKYEDGSPIQEKQENKKEVSFKVSKNEPQQSNNIQQFVKTQQQVSRNPSKSFNQNTKQQKQLPKQNLQQTQFQKRKRKSIEKYIKDNVPFTRTLSNTAFRKFYQRPCPQTYGNKNTKIGGVCYGDFMKTHNIQPHTLDNKPETYQSYTSALNYGKRTKLDLQDRWKRIQRQLAKNLDYKQLVQIKSIGEIQLNTANRDNILKININRQGQQIGNKYPEQERQTLVKTSKSLDKMATRATFRQTANENSLEKDQRKKAKSSEKPLYYVYKYKDDSQQYNCTRYARDRHGITCYVDNCFKENDQAYVNFLKKIKPIYAEKCKPEDMNIDNIRIKNYEQSKQQNVPQHYLMPNVQIPYEVNKYSRKRKGSLASTIQ